MRTAKPLRASSWSSDQEKLRPTLRNASFTLLLLSAALLYSAYSSRSLGPADGSDSSYIATAMAITSGGVLLQAATGVKIYSSQVERIDSVKRNFVLLTFLAVVLQFLVTMDFVFLDASSSHVARMWSLEYSYYNSSTACPSYVAMNSAALDPKSRDFASSCEGFIVAHLRSSAKLNGWLGVAMLLFAEVLMQNAAKLIWPSYGGAATDIAKVENFRMRRRTAVLMFANVYLMVFALIMLVLGAAMGLRWSTSADAQLYCGLFALLGAAVLCASVLGVAIVKRQKQQLAGASNSAAPFYMSERFYAGCLTALLVALTLYAYFVSGATRSADKLMEDKWFQGVFEAHKSAGECSDSVTTAGGQVKTASANANDCLEDFKEAYNALFLALSTFAIYVALLTLLPLFFTLRNVQRMAKEQKVERKGSFVRGAATYGSV